MQNIKEIKKKYSILKKIKNLSIRFKKKNFLNLKTKNKN